MRLTALDHIVLVCRDLAATRDFYAALGAAPVEERPGKWSLQLGSQKISLQQHGAAPDIARNTLPGTANLCVLTDTPMTEITDRLRALGLDILDGPGARSGATGPILSVYLHDPDGNLLEISNPL